MVGSSALAFSSARRRWAVSQSKMPPQQSQGLLHFIDNAGNFGAHDSTFQVWWASIEAAAALRQPAIGGRLGRLLRHLRLGRTLRRRNKDNALP